MHADGLQEMLSMFSFLCVGSSDTLCISIQEYLVKIMIKSFSMDIKYRLSLNDKKYHVF